MKRKISYFFILFVIIFNSHSLGFISSFPIWEDNNFIQVNSNDNNFLKLESDSAILIEQTTGQILFEKNPHEKLRPASVTKIMSLLLIMEAIENGQISLDTPIPCSTNASSMGGSQIWLDPNESLTVEEMLKAICVVSANDCTVAMAEYLAGSEELFVNNMNNKAQELGMKNTCFKNCHGIDEDGHFTTSYDIALMSRELLVKYPQITNYTTIWMDSLREGKSELVNTNRLIRTYDGATGLKTGSTSLALYNLSASATRNDLSLIAVVLRAPTPQIRFSEAKLLLDYGFNTYYYKELALKNSFSQKLPINKGTEKYVNLIFEKDIGAVLKKSTTSNIEEKVILNENLNAPIKSGDILGSVEYYLDGKIINSVNLISENNVDKIGFLNTFTLLINKWSGLLR